MPVGTYIVATEPLGEAAARALLPREHRSHRYQLGAGLFPAQQPTTDCCSAGASAIPDLILSTPRKATRKRMLAVFPQLRDARIEYAWGGYVDITMNRAPGLRPHRAGCVLPAGIFRPWHRADRTGRQAGGRGHCRHAERFDVFTRIPHRDFPGGALLRRPALVLAMLYYRLRDLL